jgi:hypothetical protein
MPIEFHEVRRGEVPEALAFAASLGRHINRVALVPGLSLLALGGEGGTLGSALHYLDENRRPVLAVDVAEGVHPGLARLLIDRAMRKAAGKGLSCAKLDIAQPQAHAVTWRDANWMSRFVNAA